MRWRLNCIIAIVGSFVDEDDPRPLPHRGHLEDRLERRPRLDGDYPVFIPGVDVDRVQHGHEQSATILDTGPGPQLRKLLNEMTGFGRRIGLRDATSG